MNDLRVLRDRQRAGQEALDSSLGEFEARGSSAMLAQTTTVKTYPTTAAAFYAVRALRHRRGRDRGRRGDLCPRRVGSVAYALNLGTQVPPSGTTVVCHAVGGRWCFRYDG